MLFANQELLDLFIEECNAKLLCSKNRIQMNYFTNDCSPWNSAALKKANEKTLKKISSDANVYALFIVKKGGRKYQIVYIGQTASKYARTRITNHLFKKDERTGAKLKYVQEHIQKGGKVGLPWISMPRTCEYRINGERKPLR